MDRQEDLGGRSLAWLKQYRAELVEQRNKLETAGAKKLFACKSEEIKKIDDEIKAFEEMMRDQSKINGLVYARAFRICIDFHGVLTDGKLNMSHDGKTLFESVHVRDTVAIRELIATGYEVYIVTQSSNPIIDKYCEKVGAIKLELRDKSEIPFEYDYAIGDTPADAPMLRKAKHAFCPWDGQDMPCDVKFTQLQTDGGRGVVAEFANKILLAR